MKRLFLLSGLILSMIPAFASAEPVEDAILADPSARNDGVTHIDLSKTLSSKTFGELRLPFSWEAEEKSNPSRIIVTEGMTKAPGVLTFDMLEMPAGIETKDAVLSIVDSLSSELSASAVMRVESMKNKESKKSIQVFKATMSGKEGDVPRKCALDAVMLGKKLLVMTVCAHETRQYDPDLPQMLDQILLMIK